MHATMSPDVTLHDLKICLNRIILEINPPNGNKRPKKEAGGHFSSLREHAHITRVSQKYEEFLADKLSSNSSALSAQNEDDLV